MIKFSLAVILFLIFSVQANALEKYLTYDLTDNTSLDLYIPNSGKTLLEVDKDLPCLVELVSNFKNKVMNSQKAMSRLLDFEINLSKTMGYPIGDDMIPGLGRNDLGLSLKGEISLGYARRNLIESIENMSGFRLTSKSRRAVAMKIFLDIPGTDMSKETLFSKTVRLSKLEKLKKRDRCPSWKLDFKDLDSVLADFILKIEKIKKL